MGVLAAAVLCGTLGCSQGVDGTRPGGTDPTQTFSGQSSAGSGSSPGQAGGSSGGSSTQGGGGEGSAAQGGVSAGGQSFAGGASSAGGSGSEVEQCGSGSLDIYTRRIEPLVSGQKPQSCSQCHLQGTGLDSYVQDTPCQTMACLLDQGEVDLASPEQSKILERILKATPQSELITAQVIQAEYDGFLEWIEYSAQCQQTECPSFEDPCQGSVGGPLPSGVLTPLGSCDENAIVDAFAAKVFSWRNRCESCHQAGAPGQCNPDYNGICAPSFIDAADPNTMAANTMYNLIGRGAVNTEDPTQSLLLLKPLADDEGGVPHLGGDKILPSEQTYQDFLEWLQLYADCYDNGNQPPAAQGLVVTIRNPLNGSTVKSDAVYLQGNARTPDQELVGDSLVWTSNQLGAPILTGTGMPVSLPVGVHVIRLTATAPDTSQLSDQITITVQP